MTSILKLLTLDSLPTKKLIGWSPTEEPWPTWLQKSKRAKPTTESKWICSLPELSYSSLFKESSHSRKRRRTSTSTTYFSKVNLILTGRRQVARTSQMTSKTWSWECSTTMERRDQPLKNSETTHGCKPHITLRALKRISWRDLLREEQPRQLTHQGKEATEEVMTCFNSLDKLQSQTLRSKSSMIWLTLISKLAQEKFGKSLTLSTATTLTVN